MDIFSELFGMFDDFDSFFNVNPIQKESRACPVCGRRWSDFRATGKFGCSRCYDTFRNEAEQVLRQAQASVEHRGKIPSKSGAQVKLKRRLAELKEQLKKAVDAEEYEKAAKIHAEIKEIEGGAK